ncbi:hypothetical protein A2641_00260 [Candidatus Nomurabacteria bacterium RIFCSPHIGHO2_01_FULL_37_25]|uniref:Type II secretion system protein GspI C-terminal domain-containing protein n=1 Tax=Candidatus Nomurabacteria bacterium RIFCSPLOWO2_01_FULL_36_16 TaxID=1801767 RepID=A0A1F6WYD3_9BACT|nr:MAG: hypothetical protein A2641_00260 [Candidatus Nomurabacteria bacterium RIFCSPHIGHO2_01_FULL_37_25]OGI75279.1 MAG: hypothetical protein A3D36_04040 [Candidatus Nomurabacteria bacterium RIFCSPHIGHO2_02_FULL_36_29]OGI86906.1 MAG: hypothetical protein A3A91_03500 [Candidatus Nomurabacteria bacterium RIFCSPLOWO2_01_FULL_36_16]OGI96833.1 MAG: hypothetical protein A3I84_02130 [Candidatus Nomurabacteria bacterium RIFCSPLOWO2_02_FULL_36_8]
MEIMKLKIKNYKRGYVLLELLFYIVFLSIFSLIVINAIIVMTRTFKETAIQAELVQSVAIMEKMSREIRQAYDIFSISATDLVLNTGASNTIEFKLVGSDIQFWDAGNNIGNLNTPNIIVTSLTFSQITTVKGKAVKIVLSLRSINDSLNRVKDFYNTIVLRGIY